MRERALLELDIQNLLETTLQHGSGIGLWIAKWSITALGGELTFQTEGEGTTVTVSLPRD